jgi:hypothetical protein
MAFFDRPAFIDRPRYFVPPQGIRGSGGILGRSYGRPKSIMEGSANPLTGEPANDPWNGLANAPAMQPSPIGFGTSSADDMAAQDVQKRLNRVKLQQARDQIAAFKAERPFQQLLQRYKLQSMQDAMAAAQEANQSYGLFPTGVGLGLGFQRPFMDISSDQGRHARGFELLKNALEDAAPPVTVEGKRIGRNTTSVPDFVDLLESGANFDPMGLSMGDRERFKEAVKIKALRDAQRSRGGF